MTLQQSHMRRLGIVFGSIGLAFVLVALPPLHAVGHLFLRLAYWPMTEVPTGLAVPVPLLLAISGGLTVGFGGMLWALGTYVSPLSSEAAGKVANITAWSWFIADSTGSVLVGAPFNVVLNLSFLLSLLYVSRHRPEKLVHA